MQRNMVILPVGKPNNFLFIALSGRCCSDRLATAAFVEEVDNSLILSTVEHKLTQGKHCFAHSATTTVPI
jgi:hypothetical protein